MNQEDFDRLYVMFDEASRMTMALAKHLRMPKA